MLTPHDTYTIAQHWITAIEYGDETGLTDAESVELSDWLSTLPRGPHTFDYGDSVEFARDEVSGLMADCVTVTVFIDSATVCG